MDTKYMVAISEFCTNHNIEISFISALRESGLIEITTVKEEEFIEIDQLRQVEKFIRLYYDLDINLEGIETISYLLQRMNSMDDEIRYLRNKLRLYENAEL
jgi:hypothetical protein